MPSADTPQPKANSGRSRCIGRGHVIGRLEERAKKSGVAGLPVEESRRPGGEKVYRVELSLAQLLDSPVISGEDTNYRTRSAKKRSGLYRPRTCVKQDLEAGRAEENLAHSDVGDLNATSGLQSQAEDGLRGMDGVKMLKEGLMETGLYQDAEPGRERIEELDGPHIGASGGDRLGQDMGKHELSVAATETVV